MSDNLRLIREYMDAWGKIPAADLADYFTEDALYTDALGATPIRGREAIRRDLTRAEASLGGSREFGVEILRVLSEGDVVVVEREEWIGSGDQRREFRAVVLFEIEGGKIKESRCYFDRDPNASGPA